MVDALAEEVGIVAACELLGRSRASHHRSKQPTQYLHPRPARTAPSTALTPAERAEVLTVLTSARFVDKSVAQCWAVLLDEGVYLCSKSTMHRVLREHQMNRERRRQARHPAKKKPHLIATGPGQVWSWDITKLPA